MTARHVITATDDGITLDVFYDDTRQCYRLQLQAFHMTLVEWAPCDHEPGETIARSDLDRILVTTNHMLRDLNRESTR